MRRLAVLVPARPSDRVDRILATLRVRGIDAAAIAAPADAENRICLDLRDAAVRAQSRPPANDVWSLEIGGERGGIPAFTEAISGASSVEVRFVCVRDGRSMLLRFGRFPYAATHGRTIERILEQCTAWIREELCGEESAGQPESYEPRASLKRVGIIDWLKFYSHESIRLVRHAVRYLFEEACWDVAVANTSVEDFLTNPSRTWLHWIAKDRREFLADPFLVCTEPNQPRVLCETRDGSRTTIVSIDVDAPLGARHALLSGEHNASYPYAFEVNGETWVAPEQHRSERLDVYHVNGSVTKVASWDLGIAAVDPSIVEYDGLWWLFCTDQNDGPHHALRVYWSESPLGPWRPHARNPAKIDVAGARPAGTFFVRDGVLYRPAQDCAARYGCAVTVQRIDVLTPQRFEETCVARIDASMLRRRGAVGVHTLSHGSGWVALDAQFVRFSLRKPLRLLRERIT